jgi:hypothetical protein
MSQRNQWKRRHIGAKDPKNLLCEKQAFESKIKDLSKVRQKGGRSAVRVCLMATTPICCTSGAVLQQNRRWW